MDGYGSYMIILFYNLVTENKIVLFHFPLHNINLTQPLDVGIFQLFKHFYTDTIDKVVRFGDEKFDKLEFLSAFQSFRNQTFKPTNIRHAFKSTEQVPFNPNVVFDKICKKQAKRVQTTLRTPYPPLPLHQRTSQGPVSVVNYRQKLQRVYTKLIPGGKTDSEQIKQLIH